MIAKRNVVRLWGAGNVPTVGDWEKDMDWCMLVQQVAYEGSGCPRKWCKVWSDWNAHRGHICADAEEPDLRESM